VSCFSQHRRAGSGSLTIAVPMIGVTSTGRVREPRRNVATRAPAAPQRAEHELHKVAAGLAGVGGVLLAQGNLSQGEIVFLLGYSAVRAFAPADWRESGLPFNAVVHRLAFDAPGLNVLALTDAVRFRQLERSRFTPFVHSGLTRTWKRLVVRGRKVFAPGDESRRSQDYPFHGRVSRCGAVSPSALSDENKGPPAWYARTGGPMLNPVERSLGGASDVHLGSLDSDGDVTRST
jgi:hypothetical protein